MKELLPTIEQWTESKKSFAIATVIQTWGSSPRPVGSSMIVSSDQEIAGSVSGGCVEGAVLKAALPLITAGTGQRIAFGVADDDAWAVGLSCGGKMQVYTERFVAFDDRPAEQGAWEQLHNCLKHNEGCVWMTRLEDGEGAHVLLLPDGQVYGQVARPDLLEVGKRAYTERKNQVIESGGESWFAQVFPRKSQMLIIGAAHITVDLVDLAHHFGFETVVIDPRGFFANKTQFSVAPDQLFDQYPAEVLPDFTLDAYTFAVVLSHDPKIDDNALHILLQSEVAYIGALGSRKTQEKRKNRLAEAGFSEAEIGRIHAPIGMAINAKTPREIALSIMGEIIKEKNAFL